MYLHEDREQFKDIIEQVSAETGRTPMVIEIITHIISFAIRYLV